jgi:hypothetical protein
MWLDCAWSMNRQRLSTALGSALFVAGWLYLIPRPSVFEKTFDENLARFPLASSFASRDPDLRDVLRRRTEKAFDGGGWRAANGALRSSLATEVEVYADDEHINAISRAELPPLLKLEGNPLLCKSYLLAGAAPGEFPEAAQEIERAGLAHLAAMENGFDRKTDGISWTKPNDEQVFDLAGQLSHGPVAMLTQAELRAEASYLDGDAELLCSASIKKHKNLLAMESHEAARAQRILIGNTSRIDFARVLSRLCRNQDNGLDCSQ